MEPFATINTQNVLISCSIGFISKDSDGINPEKALELGRKQQVQLGGNIPTAILERTLKVKSLATLRKNVTEIQCLLMHSNISATLLYLHKEKITLK